MTSQLQIPNCILISSKPSNSVQFDDLSLLKTSNYKIAGMKVGISKNKVSGISFLYKKMNGTGKAFFGCDNQRRAPDTQYYDFTVDDDDFIQILYGCYDEGVTELGIITYRGQQAQFGKYGGQKFKYLFMGFSFTAAYGKYKFQGIFESLGFRITKLPELFLSQFFSPLTQFIYPNNIVENSSQQMNDNPNQQQSSTQEVRILLITKNTEHNQNQDKRHQGSRQEKLQGIDRVMIQREIKKEKLPPPPDYQNDDFDSCPMCGGQGNICLLCFCCCLICANRMKAENNNVQNHRRR